jgi:hypothetical protein
MSSLTDLFDSYTRKARLYPVLLVAVPAIASVLLLWPGLIQEKLLPLAVTTGLPFFATSWVRSAGKRLEDRLVADWGGMPTTRMLRLREGGDNPELRRRHRDKLAALIGEPLPTAAEEIADPRRCDHRYTAAVRVLISKVRDNKDRHPRVHDENTEYGFRRNLLAAKPLALALLVVLLGVDGFAAYLGHDPQLVGAATAVHLVAALLWLTVVRRSWVRQQADTYAERLLETLEHPELTSSPPAA